MLLIITPQETIMLSRFVRGACVACIAVMFIGPVQGQSPSSPALTPAMQIEKLEQENADLKKRVAVLESQIKLLEERLAKEGGPPPADPNPAQPPMKVIEHSQRESRPVDHARIKQIDTQIAESKSRIRKHEDQKTQLKSCRCVPKCYGHEREHNCEIERRQKTKHLDGLIDKDNEEIRKVEGEKKRMQREAKEPRQTVRATDGAITHVLHTEKDLSGVLSKITPGMWITWKGNIVDTSKANEHVWTVTQIQRAKDPQAPTDPKTEKSDSTETGSSEKSQ